MTRFGYVMVTYFVTLAAIVTAFVHPSPRWVWNATASVPMGLYSVRPADHLRVGDLAVVAPPEPIARALAAGGYLPLGVPLVKPVAALPGQRVCRLGAVVTVDGRALGMARARDRFGRSLPVWRGCRVIAADQLFFMNPARGDSLDGRYFGPLPASSVVGRAMALWTPSAPAVFIHPQANEK
jgi:conjugative transfer signal peptidase TraF